MEPWLPEFRETDGKWRRRQSVKRAVPGKVFGRVLRDTGGRSRRASCDVAGSGSIYG
ncbi:hypothetical protein NOCA1260022 [metagenome]|uniref:Uncharacterized protein n=1 Tax=metagenome TaxID=256318 RepID=A0A2P2CHV5_9ZZZZ